MLPFPREVQLLVVHAANPFVPGRAACRQPTTWFREESLIFVLLVEMVA